MLQLVRRNNPIYIDRFMNDYVYLSVCPTAIYEMEESVVKIGKIRGQPSPPDDKDDVTGSSGN